jgi:hypothetical protein
MRANVAAGLLAMGPSGAPHADVGNIVFKVLLARHQKTIPRVITLQMRLG